MNGALVLRNARIWTGDPARPWADTAIALDGRFAFVGRASDADVPSGASILDAEGRLVVPGFIDGHAHVLLTGFAARAVDLKGVPSVHEAARRVAERAASTPTGGWVRGVGWDQNEWPGARFPHRRDLDAVTPDHPVALDHTSGHCIWVNTAAIRAAGITAATTVPYGGAIDIGDDGEPTGILRDNASQLIAAVVPHPSPPERVDAIRTAIEHAHRLGVTSVHAMNAGRGEYQAMLALRDSGRLRLRLRVYLTHERVDEWIERAIRTGDGDEMWRIGGVKFFADGALGSLTAWMLDPYGNVDGTGLPMQPADELERMVRRCLEAGLAPAIHAIGDRANREALDIIERAQALAPSLPRRIEHAQLLAADDLPRFARLGVTASMQPIHATQDMTKADRAWGARGSGAYAFAAVAATGANLAFSSDAPVETMDPIAGIHAAVTRRRADGSPSGGWHPKQRVSLETALAAYTSGCARAAGEEATLGRIAPACHADFAVLSHDLFALDDPMRILEARVESTVVGGEIVYRA